MTTKPSHPIHTRPSAWPVVALAAQLQNSRGETSPALTYLSTVLGRSVKIKSVPAEVLESHGIFNQSAFLLVGRQRRVLWTSGGDLGKASALGRLYGAETAAIWGGFMHLNQAPRGAFPTPTMEDHR